MTTHLFRVPLSSTNGVPDGNSGLLPSWAPDMEDFELRHGDRVFERARRDMSRFAR